MALFDFRIAPSEIHGLGLFTNQDIQKGAIMFLASPGLDQEWTEEEFAKLRRSEQREIIHSGYYDVRSGTYKLDFDVGLRFLNHSEDCNMHQLEDHLETFFVATRFIKAGEEITSNYHEYMSQEFFDLGFKPAQ